MGLFSSKKKIYVGTNVSRLVQDNLVPNAAKTGTIEALLTDSDIHQSIIEGIQEGLVGKVSSAYRYAKSGKYFYGLPSSGFSFKTQARNEILTTLSQIESNQSISIVYQHIGSLNFYHAANQWLQDTGTYNQATNLYTFVEGGKTRKVYPTFIQVKLPESFKNEFDDDQFKTFIDDRRYYSPTTSKYPTTTDVGRKLSFYERANRYKAPKYVSGIAITSPTIELGIEETVTYSTRQLKPGSSYGSDAEYETTTHTNHYITELYRIPYTVPEDHNTSDFIQVGYKVGSSPIVKYFTYKTGTGQYPLLEQAFDTPPVEHPVGLFYPRGYFRLEGANVGTGTHQKVTDSIKFFKKLGLNYEDINEEVHKNPGVGEVRQAFLEFGVPLIPKPESQGEIRYLYSFFERLMIGNKEANQFAENITPRNLASYSLDDNRRNSLIFGLRRVPQRGTANTEFRDKRFGNFLIQDKGFKQFLNIVNVDKATTVAKKAKVGKYFVEVKNDTIIHYGKQISERVCEVLVVKDPWIVYYIYNGKNTIGSLSNKDDCLIPLDKGVLDDLPLTQREEVLAKSMHLVFNSVKIVRVKWYQSGIFKAFVAVVGIALMIYGVGTAIIGALKGIAATGVALSSGALAMAVLKAVAFKFVIGAAISLVITYLAKAVGHELAGILAIIAIVAAVYGGIQGSIWAGYVGRLGVSLAEGANKALVDKINDLQDDIADFQNKIDLDKEELKRGEDLLNSNTVHLYPLRIWGETPKQFFYRTNRLNNPWKVALDLDRDFVKNSLRLPTLQDSLSMIEHSQTT